MRIKKIISTLAFSSIAFIVPFISRAATSGIWKDTSCAEGSEGPIKPCTTCDMFILVRNVIEIFRNVAVIIVTGVIVYAAVKLMLSRGNPSKAKEAKDMMTRSAIGILIIFLSYLLVNTFINLLAGGNGWKWDTITC
jgi:hypothetical protein